MRKFFAGLLGVVVGYGAWMAVKWAILLSGPFILGPLGISGERAAMNLSSVAEILGFVVFVLVLLKIYKSIVGTTKKIESIKQTAE